MLLTFSCLQGIFPSFNSQGLLSLDWTSGGVSIVGEALTINNTSHQPSVSYL